MPEHTVELVVPEGCAVDRAGETVTVTVDESESILAAARAADLWLPATCQQGWCTTCAAILLEGEVDQSAAKRFYDVDADADFVLTCVATPESDCRLRACQEEAILRHRSEHDLPPG